MADQSIPEGTVLPCPRCGEAEAAIWLDLSDLNCCNCRSCEAEFSLEEIEKIITKWAPITEWVHAFPRFFPKE